MNYEATRNRTELLGVLSPEISPEFLFFWGHRVPKDGTLTKSCLSQWYPARFVVDGTTYPTAEHYMMCEKARLFGAPEIEEQILKSADPAAAKKLGRRIRNYDDQAWKAHRVDAVVRGNLAKFGQDARLAGFLKSSGTRVLVEASPVDRIWGIGLAGDHPDAANPAAWPGLNLLGFALMDVRKQLNEELTNQ